MNAGNCGFRAGIFPDFLVDPEKGSSLRVSIQPPVAGGGGYNELGSAW